MKDLDFNVSDPRAVRIDFEIVQGAIIDLEAGKANMSTGSGAPSGGSNGDLYIDTAAGRLYVNAAGTWKYTVLS